MHCAGLDPKHVWMSFQRAVGNQISYGVGDMVNREQVSRASAETGAYILAPAVALRRFECDPSLARHVGSWRS